MSIETKL